MKGLDARLREIRGFLDHVINGKLPLNHEILYHLQVPNFSFFSCKFSICGLLNFNFLIISISECCFYWPSCKFVSFFNWLYTSSVWVSCDLFKVYRYLFVTMAQRLAYMISLLSNYSIKMFSIEVIGHATFALDSSLPGLTMLDPAFEIMLDLIACEWFNFELAEPM